MNPAGETTYRNFFCKNYNYSFYKPKKDLCSLSFQYDSEKYIEKKAIIRQNYEDHINRKNDCNLAKEGDKKRAAAEESFITTTFDPQRVLQIPSSDVSQMYYSRKICVYNLTIYEGTSGEGHCFCWNELNGKRGSNEVGSMWLHWIQSLPSNITEMHPVL